MVIPLLVLAIFAIGVAWKPGSDPESGLLDKEALIGSGLAVVVFLVLRFVWGSLQGSGGREDDVTLHHGNLHTVGGWRPLDMALALSVAGLLVCLVWNLPALRGVSLTSLLEQARPAGTLSTEKALLLNMTWPNEHDSHAPATKIPATLIAFSTALGGFLLATVFYGWRMLDPEDVKIQFRLIYRVLINKWWFDELYDVAIVRPTHWLSRCVAGFDRRWIDGLIDGSARVVWGIANYWDRIADQGIVDGVVNRLATWTYATGVSLRAVQTGRLRQYVMIIVLGAIAAFVLASFGFAR
jgi:NADH-quinone oxidoreductase subunit L